MRDVQQGSNVVITLPANSALFVGGTGRGRVARVDDRAGTFTAVAPGAAVAIGPFNAISRHRIECDAGELRWDVHP